MMTQITPDTQAQIIKGTVTWLWDTFGGPWSRKLKDRSVDEVKWRWSIGKYYTSLYERVGFVRILGRMESEPLANVFTQINVLDRPSAERRYNVTQLIQEFGPRDFERIERTERVPGDYALEEYPKMFILGRPGAGKTTFLKHTALRAINREIKKVPVFVSLRELSESEMEILSFIAHQFEVHRFPNPRPFVEDLLKDGKALVLFDGLDEVNLIDHQRTKMIRWLNDFVYQYGDCPMVITCRVAATDFSFTQFEYVEMADFDEEQIGQYIDLWFAGDETKRLGCRKALLEDKKNEAIRELVQVPLLLSLLCLVFEERNEFPPYLHEIYGEVARALLSKWDASRNITREGVYGSLTLNRKQGLLAQVAALNFEADVYFMREQVLVQQIEDYLFGVPGLEEPDGELVLRSMEVQHGILVERSRGIHSFSHLTLQEYFTARYIVANENRGGLQMLMTHVAEDRWQEVFLLTAGMLSDASEFFEAYLAEARKIIAYDTELIAILKWALSKGEMLNVTYKPAAVRAYLLSRARAVAVAVSRAAPNTYSYGIMLGFYPRTDRSLALALDHSLALNHDLERSHDKVLHYAHRRVRIHDHADELAIALDSTLAYHIDKAYSYGTELAESWQDNQLLADLNTLGPPPSVPQQNSAESLESWWERFNELLSPHRRRWDPNLLMPVSVDEAGIFLNLSAEKINTWKKYLEVNLLLQRCLQVAYLPDREAIEDRILLPPE